MAAGRLKSFETNQRATSASARACGSVKRIKRLMDVSLRVGYERDESSTEFSGKKHDFMISKKKYYNNNNTKKKLQRRRKFIVSYIYVYIY